MPQARLHRDEKSVHYFDQISLQHRHRLRVALLFLDFLYTLACTVALLLPKPDR